MRKTVTGLVAILVTAVGLWVGPTAEAADGPKEQHFVDLINQERRSRGMAALAVRSEVVSVARGWSDNMAATGVLAHNPNLSALMPSDWRRIGENVGYGATAESLHQAFMNSSGHRANILGDFNQVGVGVTTSSSGVLWVAVDFMKGTVAQLASSQAGSCGTHQNPPSHPSTSGATGYLVLGSDGGVFAYGNAPYKGSTRELGLAIDAALMTLTPKHQGYWILGSDGGIFSFGDAAFHGSVPGLGLGAPVRAIDLKPTPTGKGYWILGADGGIFSFGDAAFHGSLPGVGVSTRAVRLVPTPTGKGYWILGADGGIFSFGDAAFHGSVPGAGVQATGISMARTKSGSGYWVLGDDGGIFSFGDAGFHGSVPGLGLCESVRGVQIASTVGGAGYYIVSDTGRVFAFGDGPFYGEPAGHGITARDIAAVRR